MALALDSESLLSLLNFPGFAINAEILPKGYTPRLSRGQNDNPIRVSIAGNRTVDWNHSVKGVEVISSRQIWAGKHGNYTFRQFASQDFNHYASELILPCAETSLW